MIRFGAIAATQSFPFRIPAIEVPRIALIVAFGITASPTLARAEEASALGCINEMAVPVYGSIPWLAQISGIAMVIVRLDDPQSLWISTFRVHTRRLRIG